MHKDLPETVEGDGNQIASDVICAESKGPELPAYRTVRYVGELLDILWSVSRYNSRIL